ncbi:MAG: GatB/YqeY domain-containing protein [Candidatus Campbellbacteria bacterium]|nr:GatB/YqeY domain-containing protein [Candidatus Campbellbacteria bacterium]
MIPDITEMIAKAMKERDSLRLSVLRDIRTSITNELVASGKKPTDTLPNEALEKIIRRLLKQRNEAQEKYEEANAQEKAELERKEAEILSELLPEQATDEELEKVLKECVEEIGLSSPADKGRVIKTVLERLAGKVDGKRVSQALSKMGDN